MSDLPSYDELPVSADKPPHSAWSVWGDDDELGAINLLTRERALEGAACVRTGKSFPLNWDLEMPNPPFYGRGPLKHRVIGGGNGHDDFYDNFYPQQSSQWDALCHVGHSRYGYYNGRRPSDFTGREGARNGVEHWARHGIVGRGILLDAGRHFASVGRPIDPTATVDITPDDLREIADAQGTAFREGDILLVRTGWMEWYENETDEAQRAEIAELARAQVMKGPGLAATQDTARFLWDSHFAAAATDTSTFESWPHEFVAGKYLHMDVLALLGIPIGEMWYLDALAEDCMRDGVYEFMLTSAPLNITGGVGSPPNAIAIK